MPMSARLLPTSLLAVGLFVALAAPALPQQAGGGQAAPKVTVVAAALKDITGDTAFIGRVEAVNSVDLVARVGGFLREIDVSDGAEVKAGQLMFRIEPEQYQATLEARQADLERAEAQQALAQIELRRKQQLVDKGTSPQSELDIATANNKAAEADITAAKAAVEQARLDLSYTQITAPFDGQIGSISASVGALVGPETGALATLVSLRPIYVTFSVNERQLVTLMEARANEKENPDQPPTRFPIHVNLPNGKRLDETGKIVFAENRIDPSTGTLAVRTQFDNARGLLVPGAFVTLHVETAEPTPEVVIPQAAVQRDQRGPFVLVVGQQQTVEQRYITTGNTVGTEIIVESGLNAGESVITEGLQRVRPGAPVDAILAGTQD
ncbi:MAG: efflux RND transporter periplasmic adaptor subunit [Rhodobacteraceae bacterium]|nr:efflux RND transporter periplasmic adaptor subunit [Paracoccaceae bacterium]